MTLNAFSLSNCLLLWSDFYSDSLFYRNVCSHDVLTSMNRVHFFIFFVISFMSFKTKLQTHFLIIFCFLWVSWVKPKSFVYYIERRNPYLPDYIKQHRLCEFSGESEILVCWNVCQFWFWKPFRRQFAEIHSASFYSKQSYPKGTPVILKRGIGGWQCNLFTNIWVNHRKYRRKVSEFCGK